MIYIQFLSTWAIDYDDIKIIFTKFAKSFNESSFISIKRIYVSLILLSFVLVIKSSSNLIVKLAM